MSRKTKNDYLQIRISADAKAIIRRKAKAAGLDMSTWILHRVLPPVETKFARLLAELKTASRSSIVLASLNDFFTTLNRTEFEAATQSPLPRGLSQLLANYVAAMIETTANIKQAKLPNWLEEIPILAKPYFGTELKSLRLHLLTKSPPPFRKRNIFIDATIGDRV